MGGYTILLNINSLEVKFGRINYQSAPELSTSRLRAISSNQPNLRCDKDHSSAMVTSKVCQDVKYAIHW